MAQRTLERRDVYLGVESDQIVFSNAKLELRFRRHSGAWLELIDRETGQQVVGWGKEVPTATITVGGHTTEFRGTAQIWSVKDATTVGAGARCDAHEAKVRDDGVELRIALREGPWALTTIYFLAWYASLVERKLAISYDGDEEVLLRNAHLCIPGIRLGDPRDCVIEAPGYTTLPHHPLALLPEGRWGPMSDSIFGETPGWRTGLAVVHNTHRHQCLLIWEYSEVEPALTFLERNGGDLTATHRILVADRFRRGHSLECGTQFVSLIHADADEALTRFQAWYDEARITVPSDISDFARHAIIYEGRVGSTGFAKGTPHNPLPDFQALIDRLPSIKDLGFNTIQLMPKGYVVVHYFDIDAHYGPVQEVKACIARAHELGMRVLLDVVLHGCMETSPYLTEHPEWFCLDERGEIAFTYTYAFDHANEEWRQHVIDAMKMYVTDLDVDGFRIDAPTWNFFPNWRKDLPYRASASMQGSLELLRRARKELKPLKPGVFFHIESLGALFHTCCDLSYNYDEGNIYSALPKVLSPRGYALPWHGRRASARDLRDWLEARRLTLPQGALRAWTLDSHDTYSFGGLGQFRKEAFGVSAARALFAFCAFREGGLMSYVGAEEGSEEFYRKVIRVHNNIQQGRFSYNGVESTDEMVFLMLWEHDGRYIIPIVSFRPEETTTWIQLLDSGVREEGSYALHELMSDSPLGTCSGLDLRSREISLEADEVKVLVATPISDKQ